MQLLSSFILPKNFRGRSAIFVQLWWLVQASLFRCSPQFAYCYRRLILRAFGAKVGRGVIIRPTVRITFPWKLSIGDFSWVGDDVVLYSLAKINIGMNSVISQKSYICTGGHDYNEKSFSIFGEEINIGNGVWIATDVFIAPGVTVSDGVVIGARSSVFSNLPPLTVCVGSPAKPVKLRVFK